MSPRDLKKSMLAYTPKQAAAFEHFARRISFKKIKAIYYNRRTRLWCCWDGGDTTYTARPRVIA